MTEPSVPHFAIMRTERITTWSHAYWVGQHNDRGMETKNADKAAPPPFHSIGTGDARADLMAAHAHFNPKMIAGAVLGLEFVFTASPEAFDGLSKSRHMFKAHQLLDAARAYLEERYPYPGQIVQLTLHLDERVPHVHGIACPVHLRVDRRGGEREYYRDAEGKRRWRTKAPDARKPEWMLSADRDMGGKAQLAIHQSEWAKAVEHIGLVRGRHRSGAAHTTNKEHVAELDRRIAATTVEREGLGWDRAAVTVEAERQQEAAAEIEKRAAAFEAERAAWSAAVLAEEAALSARRDAIVEAEARLDEARVKAKDWRDRSRQRELGLDDRQRDLAKQERTIAAREERLQRALADLDARGDALADLADATVAAMQMIDTGMLPVSIKPRFFSAANELGVAIVSGARYDPSLGVMAASRTVSSHLADH